MHYESFITALQNFEMMPNDLQIIDVGCGPGTATYAIGEHHLEQTGRRLRLRYLGIDLYTHMHNLAHAFLSDANVFENAEADFVTNFDSATAFCLTPATSRAVVFVCSYFFRQSSGQDSITALAELVRLTLEASELPVYLLMQDANFSVAGDFLSPGFRRFKAHLFDAGIYLQTYRHLIEQGHRRFDLDSGQVTLSAPTSKNVQAIFQRIVT